MKYALWYLSAAAIGGVGTLLAASLPVPPSLPSARARHVRAQPAAFVTTASPAPATPATASAASPVPVTPTAASGAQPSQPPAASPPAQPAAPPVQAAAPAAPAAAPPSQAAAGPPAPPAMPTIVRLQRVIAELKARNQKSHRPARHLAKATQDRHPRVVARAVVPPPPPAAPYPRVVVRPPTHIAMGPPPPPYGPYWRMPYPPEY
jgi:hypothetical protein